jgi:hypothetical protein
LKEKFLLNFQGFQADLDSEENFLLCIQREKETSPNFYRRFLQMKVQVPEVSDDQVIAQVVKALRAGPLPSHLVREWPKAVLELYEQFTKFSKSEIQHFRGEILFCAVRLPKLGAASSLDTVASLDDAAASLHVAAYLDDAAASLDDCLRFDLLPIIEVEK